MRSRALAHSAASPLLDAPIHPPRVAQSTCRATTATTAAAAAAATGSSSGVYVDFECDRVCDDDAAASKPAAKLARRCDLDG